MTDTRPMQWRVTSFEAAKAPAETEPREASPTPRVTEQPQHTRTEPIHAATTEKTIPKAPTPRVPTKTHQRQAPQKEWK